KTMMYTESATWHRLMATLARATTDYLNLQIAAGADLVQLFDSWVGVLGPDDYRRYILPHSAAVMSALSPRVPVIHFGTAAGSLLELMREAGGDVIGLDWRVDLGQTWARLGYGVGVQGNLDPVALFADIPEIRRRVRAIVDQAAGHPGHIFNLGHGILPETPVDQVRALVDAVHDMSRKGRWRPKRDERGRAIRRGHPDRLRWPKWPRRDSPVPRPRDRRTADFARALRRSRSSLRGDRRTFAVQRDYRGPGRGARRAARVRGG